MKEIFKKYLWPILGGVIGLILAILIFSIGFFKTLLIFIFVILGAAIGFYIKKSSIFLNIFK